MALTIREALKFGGLFGAVVVAGQTGLDTPIESISVLEVAEGSISRWVLKNQLYITSFYAICDNVKQQKIVIETLIEYGCCGLVLCYIGTWIRQVDPDIIRICDENRFPLIQARTDVSYIEILNPIINLLYEENIQAADVNDYSMVRNDFLNLIVNEENMDVVFRQMNQRLEKKISYYDTYGKTIYSDRGEPVVQAEEEYLREHFNHILYACSRDGYTVEEILGKPCLIVLIRSQKNLFGLFITDCDEGFSYDKEGNLINSLVVSGALILRKRNRTAEFREKALQEYVADLLVWNFPSDDKAIERGTELGLSIQDKSRVVLININSIQQMVDPKVQLEMQDYVKRVLLSKVESFMKTYNQGNWLALRSDTILLFLSDRKDEIDLADFGRQILKIFEGKPNLSVSIGVSDSFASVTALPCAYHQAFQAAVIGREYYGENRVVFHESVYFFQKLRDMGGQQETQEICRRFLAPVLEYDRRHGTDLTHTMRCIMENNGNTMRAAQQMYVHKNTILQRKGKITELFGYTPFEMPHLLNFLIAFDIMKER
ncbi:MAG: PucR family transcriptional regulator ligand-binding domain-containing protein [Lachnospiraceae bacterium]|nr:PucR family transcriptional regulator ligand-binding domain-containing protein [Lachnospiraceae bacterium]